MALDIVTTKINLSSGFVHEANGFMAFIVQNDILFIGVKTIGTIIILFLIKNALKSDIKWGVRGMVSVMSIYTFVVINNIYWIMRYL